MGRPMEHTFDRNRIKLTYGVEQALRDAYTQFTRPGRRMEGLSWANLVKAVENQAERNDPRLPEKGHRLRCFGSGVEILSTGLHTPVLARRSQGAALTPENVIIMSKGWAQLRMARNTQWGPQADADHIGWLLAAADSFAREGSEMLGLPEEWTYTETEFPFLAMLLEPAETQDLRQEVLRLQGELDALRQASKELDKPDPPDETPGKVPVHQPIEGVADAALGKLNN